MTRDEFERGYAELSGVTVKWLHQNGLRAVPWDCGKDGCSRGWQMMHLPDLDFDVVLEDRFPCGARTPTAVYKTEPLK